VVNGINVLKNHRLNLTPDQDIAFKIPGPNPSVLHLSYQIQQSHTYVNEASLLSETSPFIQSPCMASRTLSFTGQQLQCQPLTIPSACSDLGQFCHPVGLFMPDASVDGPRDYCTQGAQTHDLASSAAAAASQQAPLPPKNCHLSFPNLIWCFKAASSCTVYNIFITTNGCMRANVDGFEVNLKGLIGANLCALCDCMQKSTAKFNAFQDMNQIICVQRSPVVNFVAMLGQHSPLV